jgi:hypothetical protein
LAGALPGAQALAQQIEPPDGTRIASAVVSGINPERLSPGLRGDIDTLAGAALDRERLRALAARIETEQPRYVAAVRATLDSDGAARVVFIVARIPGPGEGTNVNARHVVEDVELRGVRDDEVSADLRAALQGLAGRQFDPDEADQLETRLRDALPEHHVSRRSVRGSQPGRITLVFDVRRADWARWLRFEPQDANLIFHSKQGWGASLPLSFSSDTLLISPTFAIDIGDELIEEYGGFSLRIESRRVGSERLGAYLEWSTFDQTWREPTLSALAVSSGGPEPYRNRTSLTPMLKFAITRQLSVAGGVRVTELDPLSEAEGLPSQMANAAIGSVTFSERSPSRRRPRHQVDASLTAIAGTEALESDLVYRRYVGQAGYVFRQAHHEVRVTGMGGRTSGNAPLFERFSLGDSRTLRGWNKYDIAPAGGDRMFHASLEYSFRALGLFLDAGSVWDAGTDRRVRFATGLTATPGPAFFTVGFPLNTSEFGAVFTMGVRFSGPAVGIRKY